MKKTLDPIKLKQQYTKWLEQETAIKKVEEYIEITSPFLDRYNDCLQIYAKQDEKGNIQLTDDAYILNNLQMEGIDLSSNKTKTTIQEILNKYNVKINNQSLTMQTTIEEFPQKILLLIQAMLNIDAIGFNP